MSDFLTFVELGIRHILDVNGLDHVLFLFALAAAYRPSDWRAIIGVVTAFTLGHSITLAASVSGVLAFSQPVVEFLIPLTIVLTCVENIVVRDRARGPLRRAYRPALAAVFGLIHGAGFGGYLKALFVTDISVPLLGFNVGIELAQIAVLALVFAAVAIADRGYETLVRVRNAASPPRLRVVAISAAVFAVSSRWAVERAPW